MIEASLACRVDGRHAALRQKNAETVRWNGIDYVEPGTDRDELIVRLLCGAESAPDKSRWQLFCGRREAVVAVTVVDHASGSDRAVLQLDRSLLDDTYTLCVNDSGFDPRHSSILFTVASDTTDVDPKPQHVCPPAAREEPELNYLAKDYAGFRQLLLDRLAQVLPEWRERHVPDVGMTLIELLAYVGDYLSYFQDAVGTEAYLDTARQRLSVRRHARLVDYDLDEGCNARAFVQVAVAREDLVLDPDNVQFYTQLTDRELQDLPVLARRELGDEPHRRYTVFEPMELHRPCRRDESDVVRNVPGFCGWLLAAGNWLLDRLPTDCASQVRDCATAESADGLALLGAVLQRAVSLVVQQDCLFQACRDAGVLAADSVRAAIEAIAHRPLRNRCLLYEAAPHLVRAPGATSELRLSQSLNKMLFYTWSQTECCLPAGATRATLLDEAIDVDEPYFETQNRSEYLHRMSQPTRLARLQAGDLLIFAEQIGARTHSDSDADPAHRQAVRLARVTYDIDPVADRRIVEIEWHADDALTFPLCVSSRNDASGAVRSDVSVAYGNIVLVDHGAKIEREVLDVVANPPAEVPGRRLVIPPRPFRPRLDEPEITFAEPITGCPSALRLIRQESHHATPQVCLRSSPPLPADSPDTDALPSPPLAPPELLETDDGFVSLLTRLDRSGLHRLQRLAGGNTTVLNPWIAAKADGNSRPTQSESIAALRETLKSATQWKVRPHLYNSHDEDRHFVLEIDDDRRARLRFGDGIDGRRPEPGESFWVDYRVGNGAAGNVGAGKIAHLVYRDEPVTGITRVWNPLAAQGAKPYESLRHAKLMAPSQSRKPLRAIVDRDYTDLVRRDFGDRVHAAAARFDWTGCWYEVAVAIDPASGVDFDRLQRDVERKLRSYQRIGHRVRVQRPVDVPLDLALTVCVADGHLRAHVQRELLLVFGNEVLPDGSRAFFHPDNLTFGEPIYLSRIIHTARRVSGVENVMVTRFQRLGHSANGELETGLMTFQGFEIPRLDNNGRAPHLGRLCLDMRGAR